MNETPPISGMAHAVRRATRHSPADDQSCPGAEPLAAFVEDRLPDAEHGAVVAHLADCERCQRLVATLVQAEASVVPLRPQDVVKVESTVTVPVSQPRPTAEVVAFPVRHARVPWRWVAPVAAATAAVLAWVVVRPLEMRRRPRPSAGEMVARVEDRPSALEAVGPAPSPNSSREANSAPQTLPPSGAPAPGGASTVRPGASAPSVAPSAPGARAQAQRAAADEVLDGRAPATPPLQDAARRATAAEPSTASAAPPPATSPAPRRDSPTAASPLPAPSQAPLEERLSVGSPSARAPEAQQKAVIPQPDSAARGVNAPPRAELSLERQRVDEPARRSGRLLWRAAAGRFEVSRDEGRSWTTTVLPEGADVTLAEVVGQPSPANAALASASRSDVWWLAGRRGFVARVADGRLAITAAPSADDVVALEGVDVARATVRTSAGSVFETLDAGRTWRPVPTR